MKNISNLSTQCRNAEADGASIEILTAFSKNDWSGDTYLSAIIADLTQASDNLTKAVFRTHQKSKLDVLNKQRNQYLKDLFVYVEGSCRSPQSEIKSAALVVSEVLDKYGLGITRASYIEKTSHISSLLGDLAEPAILPSVETIPGCNNLITQLSEAQDNFEDNRVAYEAEKAMVEDQKNATELKKEVLYMINHKLLVYLRSMSITKSDIYGNIINTVAEIIQTINSKIRRRNNKDVEVVA